MIMPVFGLITVKISDLALIFIAFALFVIGFVILAPAVGYCARLLVALDFFSII